MQQFPTMNGVSPSWAEVQGTVNIAGGPSLPNIDWKAFSWDSNVERGEQRGPGGRVRARTTGKPNHTASATVYQSGLLTLVRALIPFAPKDSAGRPQLSKVKFDLVLKWSVNNDPDIIERRFKGCSLDKDAGSADDGSVDPTAIDIDLNPLEITMVVDGQEVVLL